MRRLSSATLDALPDDVIRPAYDRAAVRAGVVHLGIGAFHRAHQAAVFDDVLNAGDLRWGIVAASLRSPRVRDQMALEEVLQGVDRAVARISHDPAHRVGANRGFSALDLVEGIRAEHLIETNGRGSGITGAGIDRRTRDGE